MEQSRQSQRIFIKVYMTNGSREQLMLNDAYNNYADEIFRYALIRVKNEQLAEDIMQETFLKTSKYVLNDKGEIRNVRAFLYRIASNLIVDWSRTKKESSLEEILDSGVVPNEIISIDDREADILAKDALDLLQQLEEPYLTFVTMRFLNEFTYKEIAKILGVPEVSVRVGCHRGVKKLQELAEKNKFK